jgi:hypothetical protein
VGHHRGRVVDTEQRPAANATPASQRDRCSEANQQLEDLTPPTCGPYCPAVRHLPAHRRGHSGRHPNGLLGVFGITPTANRGAGSSAWSFWHSLAITSPRSCSQLRLLSGVHRQTRPCRSGPRRHRKCHDNVGETVVGSMDQTTRQRQRGVRLRGVHRQADRELQRLRLPAVGQPRVRRHHPVAKLPTVRPSLRHPGGRHRPHRGRVCCMVAIANPGGHPNGRAVAPRRDGPRTSARIAVLGGWSGTAVSGTT